jgi:hypothetical protein
MTNYIRWFHELGMKDVPLVGGKTASWVSYTMPSAPRDSISPMALL